MSATLFPVRKLKQADLSIELQIRVAKLPEPEREYRFATHLGRRWAFDFAWPAEWIAFEQEGATFGRAVFIERGYETRRGQRVPIVNRLVRLGGRHTEGTGFDKDCEKYSTANALGWRVIRASTRMIRDGDAIRLLEFAFQVRRQTMRVVEQI